MKYIVPFAIFHVIIFGWVGFGKYAHWKNKNSQVGNATQ